jgi:hypothetical protein
MATQQIEFEAPSGLTLTAKLFTAGSDTVAYTASAVTEQTNRKSVYRATFSSVASGVYQLIAFDGSDAVAVWWGEAENTAQTFTFGTLISAGSDVAGVRSASGLIWGALYASHQIAASFGKLMTEIFAQSVNSRIASAVPDDLSTATSLAAYYGEEKQFTLEVVDDAGDPYDFTGLDISICIEKTTGENLEVLETADTTISGNIVTFTTDTANDYVGLHRWALRRTDTNRVILQGTYTVIEAALE